MSLAATLLVTACADPNGRTYVIPETIEREFTRWTGGGCEFDSCGQVTGWEVPVATPVGVKELGLLVTVRFIDTVSESDGALAVVTLVPNREKPGKGMPPGRIPLAPTNGGNAATTLVWVQKDVPAEGRIHLVSFSLLPTDGDGNLEHGATALRGVVAVELRWARGYSVRLRAAASCSSAFASW